MKKTIVTHRTTLKKVYELDLFVEKPVHLKSLLTFGTDVIIQMMDHTVIVIRHEETIKTYASLESYAQSVSVSPKDLHQFFGKKVSQELKEDMLEIKWNNPDIQMITAIRW